MYCVSFLFAVWGVDRWESLAGIGLLLDGFYWILGSLGFGTVGVGILRLVWIRILLQSSFFIVSWLDAWLNSHFSILLCLGLPCCEGTWAVRTGDLLLTGVVVSLSYLIFTRAIGVRVLQLAWALCIGLMLVTGRVGDSVRMLLDLVARSRSQAPTAITCRYRLAVLAGQFLHRRCRRALRFKTTMTSAETQLFSFLIWLLILLSLLFVHCSFS